MRKLKLVTLLFFSILSIPIQASDAGFDYESFVSAYFAAWLNVQKPNAQPTDLENYLEFFTDDVGYQHLPYSNDDSRLPDGKEAMRKGMSYYLGKHSKYLATLNNQSYGYNVIVIEYTSNSEGIHPDTGELATNESKVLEILELDDDKISVLRHYSE